ncbi:MAG: ankyrin repeat domain-containing protein [Spirochaetota bacterium]
MRIIILFLAASMLCPFDTNAFKRAIADNNSALTARMISEGALPNCRWEYNGTPIMTAAGNGADDTLKLLIERGATNFNVRETWGNMGETALIKAAKKGHTSAARILAKYSDINAATTSGMTALMFAARNNDTALIDALVARKADVNRTNKAGVTALIFAVERGNRRAVERLFTAKADARIALPNGLNALRLALYQNDGSLAHIIAMRSGGARSIPLFETYQFAVTGSDIGMHASSNGYSYRIGTNNDGRIVLHLSSAQVSIAIIPSLGNRIMSLRYGTSELLALETNISLYYDGGGIPILYPTPNAVADATFIFDGRSTLMDHPFAPSPAALHGIVRDAAWEFEKPVFTNGGIAYISHYTVDEKNPRFSAFPYVHRLTVIYTVISNTVRIEYAVKNSDARRLGFGFGLHPYWRIIGTNMRVQIDIPTTLKGMTGPVLPAEGVKNIVSPKPLSQLQLNDMYYPRKTSSIVRLFYDTFGITLTQTASEDFTHVIAWAPGGKPYIALEDQTCSADAHNRYAAGAVDTSHLIIVNPGETKRGAVAYEFSAGK